MVWKGKATCSGGSALPFSRCGQAGRPLRYLHCQNVCLLLKFIHKLVRGDDTPWARWVRRWYGAGGIG
jgi:hypothetical protein